MGCSICRTGLPKVGGVEKKGHEKKGQRCDIALLRFEKCARRFEVALSRFEDMRCVLRNVLGSSGFAVEFRGVQVAFRVIAPRPLSFRLSLSLTLSSLSF